jgi:hypothetical protein
VPAPAQLCLMPEQRNVTCNIDGCVQTVSVTRCANWFNYALSCTWEGNVVACCDGWVNDYGSGLCGGIQAGAPSGQRSVLTADARLPSARPCAAVERADVASFGDRP